MADQIAAPASLLSATPLVGRAREQALLRAHLDAALAGHGSVVLVGGEAGIGKTALIEAQCAAVAERGALVLIGRCYDLSETPPYGPWVEALARVSHTVDLPRLPTVLLAPERDGEQVTSTEAIVRRVQEFLVALAARVPLVFLLDDLHWADPASLDLLRALARELGALRLLLIATYRSDELTRRHPLYALLPTIERESHATRLDLRPLNGEAIGALVTRPYPLPEADTTRLVAWLYSRAEGNAFFTTQLVRALVDEGVLRGEHDGWTLGDLDAVGVPPPLRQVLDARLARLGETAQQHLTVAAILGQEVPLALWATLAATDEDGLLDTIERAVEARLLEALPTGEAVRFAHALIREALYEGYLPMRRRRIHLRAGEALSAIHGADPDAVAYHFQQAGDPRAAAWLITAGERAQRAYAWISAAGRYEAALTLLETHGHEGTERTALLLRLARLRRYTDSPRSIAYLEEAARWGARNGDHALVAFAIHESGLVRCLAGDLAAGLAGLQAGVKAQEALSPEDRARFAALLTSIDEKNPPDAGGGTLALWLAIVGRYTEARAIGEQAAEAPQVSADAHIALATIYAICGLPEKARRALARARTLHQDHEHHFQLGLALYDELTLVALPYGADEREELQRLATAAEGALARAASVLPDGATPEIVYVPTLYLHGHWAEARRIALAARLFRPLVVPVLGALARAQGDSDLAWELIREVLPAGSSTTPGNTEFHLAFSLQRLAAALALDAGDHDAAQSWLKCHDRWQSWSGAILGQAEGQLGWAVYYRATGNLELALQHARQAFAHATKPRQPLILLAAHRLLGALATAERRFSDADHEFAAALALAERCAAPYERALTLLALAEGRAVREGRDEALALVEEAKAHCKALGAQPALARAEDLGARLAVPPPPRPALPFGLTTREAEVLRLVVEGLTNAQAAERLFVTPRTINGHLTSVYTKLGVEGRAAAIRTALAHGLA